MKFKIDFKIQDALDGLSSSLQDFIVLYIFQTLRPQSAGLLKVYFRTESGLWQT